MDRTALHLELRNALSLADELGRYEHARGDDDLVAHLAALRTVLAELERDVGRGSYEQALSPVRTSAERVGGILGALRARRGRVPRELRSRVSQLVASAERVRRGMERPDGRVPSKPLLGLPLARIVPQDAHSAVDYAVAAAYLVSGRLARTERGRNVGMALSGAVGGAALVTDDRLGAVKLLPIEVHEALDLTSGLVAVVAPFALGYARRDPVPAVVQVAAGLVTIVTSLFTDYRASSGVTRPMRSKGGPEAREAKRARGRRRGAVRGGPGAGARVSDAQRPLEGLSSAPTDWLPDGPRSSD